MVLPLPLSPWTVGSALPCPTPAHLGWGTPCSLEGGLAGLATGWRVVTRVSLLPEERATPCSPELLPPGAVALAGGRLQVPVPAQVGEGG